MTTAVRVVTLLTGGVALGMTLLIAVVYHQARHVYIRPQSMVSPNHVAYMGAAHMCLIVGLMCAILVRVRDNAAFNWWVTPFALVGFLLTIFALINLLRSQQVRKLHSDVEAHIHSS